MPWAAIFALLMPLIELLIKRLIERINQRRGVNARELRQLRRFRQSASVVFEHAKTMELDLDGEE